MSTCIVFFKALFVLTYPVFTFSFSGMTHAKFKERLDFLMDFLDLPSKTRALINMSGGQQRRHSALKSEKKSAKIRKKKSSNMENVCKNPEKSAILRSCTIYHKV